jgi:hypothetical protein
VRRADAGAGEEVEWVSKEKRTGRSEGVSVINRLDELVQEAKGKSYVEACHNFTQEESNMSSPANSSSQLEVVKQKFHSGKHRKPLSRLPFHH